MPFLFHQNMLRFGGANPDTNDAYQLAFGGIAGALPGPILVAGFTEIMNNNAATRALSGQQPVPHQGPMAINLCGALGVGWGATIACRQTAPGVMEYIGFGFAHAPLEVRSYGRILIHIQGNQHGGVLHLIHDIAPAGAQFINWCNNLPQAATVDYQGLVYAVVRINGINPITFAVGYTHNVYAIHDFREALTAKLPEAANLIRTDPAMPANGVVYVCGDFNELPVVRRRHGTVMQTYAQPTLWPAAGGPVHFTLNAAQIAAGGEAGGTTLAGSLFDYSFSTILLNQPNTPVPWIDVRTMNSFIVPQPGNGKMSDHVASILQI
jgi:hypothetical protein